MPTSRPIIIQNLSRLRRTHQESLSYLYSLQSAHPEIYLTDLIDKEMDLLEQFTDLIEHLTEAGLPKTAMEPLYNHLYTNVLKVLEDTLGRSIPFEMSISLMPDETIH